MGRMLFVVMVVASVIIGDLYVEGTRIAPAKTQPPLPVDTQTVLTPEVTGERLQPVARRTAQKIQRCGRIGQLQLTFGLVLKRPKMPGTFAFEQLLRFLSAKLLIIR